MLHWQNLSLPIPGLDFRITAEQDAVLMITYTPEAEFNVTYYKSVPLISGATIKQAFQQASSVPFSLIVDDELADMKKALTYLLKTLSITSGCSARLPRCPLRDLYASRCRTFSVDERRTQKRTGKFSNLAKAGTL